MINKDRMLALTDGVIAIAATILVLQLHIPDKITSGAIFSQIPTLLAYIISFVVIILAWHEHHDALKNAKLINHRIFLLNGLWIFTVTMFPIATGVIGNSPNHKASVLLYIGIMLIMDLVLWAECAYIEHVNKILMVDREIIFLLRKVNLIGYVLALVVTFIVPIYGLGLTLVACIVNIIILCRYDDKRTREIQAAE